MSKRIELTILLPCLNEADALPLCIMEASKFIRSLHLDAEILVVDNGSTDDSIKIAKAFGARLTLCSTRGYGAALRHGIQRSRGQFVIFGDSDGSYDLRALAPFLTALRAGFDLVVGNRFAGGIEWNAMPWKNRYIGNPVLSGIARHLFRIENVSDFHSGLRGVRRDSFRELGLTSNGMEFSSELIIRAARSGQKMKEVPIRLRRDSRRNSTSHLRPLRDGARHLGVMAKEYLRW